MDAAVLDQACLRNRLLSRLSAEDFAVLADALEPVRYDAGTVLVEAGAPMPFAHFLEDGVASVVVRSPGGLKVEVGLIGREGLVHPAVVLGSDRIQHLIVMQVPGMAYRIPSDRLLDALEDRTSLRRTLLLFVQAYSVQGSHTALSNAVHGAEERLARWLLMCHDRCDGDDLHLTHEFMAYMMAVRRPTVTNALHILEGARLIRAERGVVQIRDRAALEQYAADAYGQPEAEYRRLLGPL